MDKALEINPGYADAWFARGIAQGVLGKPEEAIKCYDKVIEIDPEDASAWYNRAYSKVKEGDIDDGSSDLKNAIEIDKDVIELAKQDKNCFENIRNDERFKALAMK